MQIMTGIEVNSERVILDDFQMPFYVKICFLHQFD